MGDLFLDLEDVRQFPVVGLRPEVKTLFGTDELGGDAKPIPRTTDTAFQEAVRAQRLEALVGAHLQMQPVVFLEDIQQDAFGDPPQGLLVGPLE